MWKSRSESQSWGRPLDKPWLSSGSPFRSCQTKAQILCEGLAALRHSLGTLAPSGPQCPRPPGGRQAGLQQTGLSVLQAASGPQSQRREGTQRIAESPASRQAPMHRGKVHPDSSQEPCHPSRRAHWPAWCMASHFRSPTCTRKSCVSANLISGNKACHQDCSVKIWLRMALSALREDTVPNCTHQSLRELGRMPHSLQYHARPKSSKPTNPKSKCFPTKIFPNLNSSSIQLPYFPHFVWN